MRRIGGILIGAILGGMLAVLSCWAVAVAFGISQAEGAYAMQVAFFWMPAGAVIGAIAGAAAAGRR